jgi:DNA-binding Lrp family transcriptional regulator
VAVLEKRRCEASPKRDYHITKIMPKKSDIPERILSILQENPSATREEVAQILKVTYPAVQKHWRALQDEGLIVPSFHVKHAGQKSFRFWVFVETRPASPSASKAEDFQTRFCRDLALAFREGHPFTKGLTFGGTHQLIGGEQDVILIVHADEVEAVGRFVTGWLRPHPAVARSSVSWSRNWDGERDSVMN